MAKSIPLKYYISKNSVVNEDRYLENDVNLCSYGDRLSNSEFPIIPMLAFGIDIPRDLMISLSDDDDWGMIEVCELKLNEKESIWFTLDSKLDGTQYIGLPRNYKQYESEFKFLFPAETYESDLQVNATKLNNKYTEYEVIYKRLDGHTIHFSCRSTNQLPKKYFKNGNPMNHSESKALITIYLEGLAFLKDFKWLGEKKKIYNILFKDFTIMLAQSVIGIIDSKWQQIENKIIIDEDNEFEVLKTQTHSSILLTINSKPLTQYRYQVKKGRYELSEIILNDTNQEIGKIRISPPLPDLRFDLGSYEQEHKFTFSNKNQKGFMQGIIYIKAEGPIVNFNIRGLKPFWSKERPIDCQLYIKDEHSKGISRRI